MNHRNIAVNNVGLLCFLERRRSQRNQDVALSFDARFCHQVPGIDAGDRGA